MSESQIQSAISAAEARKLLAKPKQSKFRNVPTVIDGIRFASKRESVRYRYLKQLEMEGEIRDLRLQPRYPLVVNAFHICTYVADFEYCWTVLPRLVTEDAKGVRTRDFINKAKLFRALYGREVTLV